MAINKSKSGLLELKQRFKDHTGQQINGFPYVQSYKYLGLQINSNLDIESHLTAIARKTEFITYRLTPIRLQKHFQLNINLFLVFLWPSFSLALSIYHFLSQTQK